MEEEKALELEKKEAAEELVREQKRKEEAEAIARQEAYEKAANEEVVVDQTPRPIPPEVTATLAPVAEGDEGKGKKEKSVYWYKKIKHGDHYAVYWLCFHEKLI